MGSLSVSSGVAFGTTWGCRQGQLTQGEQVFLSTFGDPAGECSEANKIFYKSLESPNAVTFASVLKASGSLGAMDKGLEIHAEVIRDGLLGKSTSVLVDMYRKSGTFGKAGRDGGTFLDAMSFVFILGACGSTGAAEQGEQLHAKAPCGFRSVLAHLEGRQVLLKSAPGEIVKPSQFKALKDEGMPMYQRPFMKGKLYILSVDFSESSSLSTEQCKALEEIPPSKPSSQLTKIEPELCEETILLERGLLDKQDFWFETAELVSFIVQDRLLVSRQLSLRQLSLRLLVILVSRSVFSGYWLADSSVSGYSGSGPSAGTQGSATQDPHIAASDSSSDFDVMEGYPMQQHPESSSQDMHALGQQPGISMFSRLKETLSRATRSEHATNEINEGGGEVNLPFTSQIYPVLSESAHVSTPATTPIGLSKLTPSETLLPDGRSLVEVQEVERYILAAREKEIESLRKAEQRRATLAKAPMTSTNPLQSPELTTLTSQPIGSHIASGSKDTPNTSILDGVFLNENWEYNLQTEKLTDLYTSYTYHYCPNGEAKSRD
ncbi:hypothetical protein L7F22_034722 [Adiantum nelumboides]|nr:hypothetical protein [Adiantum nelumboides]